MINWLKEFFKVEKPDCTCIRTSGYLQCCENCRIKGIEKWLKFRAEMIDSGRWPPTNVD